MIKKKILVVDDELDVQSIISFRLEINGYKVSVASDGQEGLDKIKAEKPNLVLLDLMLPKINGFEICRMIKFDDKFKDLPIIILSALDKEDDRKKAMEAGADAYFLKPFDLEVLLEKINSLLTGK
ncbi:MAG: response regulator [Candidatus Omnitrophota bacterium]|jgi:DNA-binding response OmpR family regulator|nr:response regulator [Candidatus Omnitrophota bacterium]MDD5665496.1 response regulator [Candidatus Omnitrophota bacterium]